MTTTPTERAPYPLTHEPDGTSWTARENLTDVLERELLGPAGGPTEILDTSPEAAYLVGRIAPSRLVDALPAGHAAGRTAGDSAGHTAGDTVGNTLEDDADDAGDVGDDIDALAGRGVPLTSVEDAAPGGDSTAPETDGTPDDNPQQRGLMIPASMGLRFQVPADLPHVTVTASWGVYRPVKEEDRDPQAARNRRYQREPVQERIEVALADLLPGVTRAYPVRDDVVLRVDRHDDPARDRVVVELALCNDRVASRRIPVDAWLYQTRLEVDGDGQPAFLPVDDPLLDDGYQPGSFELRRLRLQYRDRLEFAVGRTCSVDWEQAPGTRRARRLWTTWVPVAETPRTEAEDVAGALLDMRALAEATRGELDEGLRPIVAAYADWLDGQQSRAQDLPDHLRDEGLDAVIEARQVQKALAAGLDHLLANGNDEALRCFRFMNTAMAEQRVHSQIAERRARVPRESPAAARAAVLSGGPRAHSWRTFQLAFILMQLPLLATRPPRRGRASSRRRSCCSSPPAVGRPRPISAWRRTRSRSAAGMASWPAPTGRSMAHVA